jgi:hypothetical protein
MVKLSQGKNIGYILLGIQGITIKKLILVAMWKTLLMEAPPARREQLFARQSVKDTGSSQHV